MAQLNELFSLEGRVAVITGGDGRLGIEHAKALCATGAVVYSFDTARSDELAKIGTHIDVDITSPEQIASAVAQVVEKEGRIDILINNASSFYPTPIGRAEEKDWDNLIAFGFQENSH